MNKYLFILLSIFSFSLSAQPLKNFLSEKQTIQLSTGITMKYVETEGQGESVMLLHGYTDTGRSFFPTIEALTELDPSLKIYALDQRGHGETSMPEGPSCISHPETCFTPADFARDVIAFMDKKNISKAYVVGHSMGSVVAQELAIQHSKRIKGTVLIGSFTNGKTLPLIHEWLIPEILENLWASSLRKESGFSWPNDAYRLRPSELDTALTNWIATDWVADPTAQDDFLRAIYQETMETPLGTWIGAIRALGEMDNRKRLEKVKTPVLVLWATQDSACPAPDQEELKQSLEAAVVKNKTTYIFKTYGKQPLPESGFQENDLGHNLQWGAPVQVAADIASFIKTGKPVSGLPHADPTDLKDVIVDVVTGNIEMRGKARTLSSTMPLD
jgi:non-heme chloroperoxidase